MCSCTSCIYTDSFASEGFEAWPRGAPKGPRKAAAEYAAHVAHSFYGALRTAPKPDFDAVSFYGTPKGMTREDVRAALRKSFS